MESSTNRFSNTIKEATESQSSSEFKDQANKMMGDFSQRAQEFYDQAQDWLSDSENVRTIAFCAAAGLIGFFLGKSMGSRPVGKVGSRLRDDLSSPDLSI